MAVAAGKHFVQGFGDGPVRRHPTHKKDRFGENALLEGYYHTGNTLAKGVKHGFYGNALLLQMYEITFGKYRAAGGNARRAPLKIQGQSGEVLDLDAQAVGLLLHKTARTCGAKRIGSHLPGLFQPIFQLDYQ